MGRPTYAGWKFGIWNCEVGMRARIPNSYFLIPNCFLGSSCVRLGDKETGIGQLSVFPEVVYGRSDDEIQTPATDVRRPRAVVRDVPDHVRRSREHRNRRA